MTHRITIANLPEDLKAAINALEADRSRVAFSRSTLEARISDGAATYGVNTGYCFPMIPSGKAHNEMLLGEADTQGVIDAKGSVLV